MKRTNRPLTPLEIVAIPAVRDTLMGMSQTEAAQRDAERTDEERQGRAPLNQSMISRYLRRLTEVTRKEDLAPLLAEQVGLKEVPAYLLQRYEQRAVRAQKVVVVRRYVPEGLHDFPLYGYMPAGAFSDHNESTDAEPIGRYYTDAPAYAIGGKTPFAVELRGNSMTAPIGQTPSFPAGCHVLVHPGQLPNPGDFVAVQGEDGGVTFKQLLVVGTKKVVSEEGNVREVPIKVLHALNPAYKDIQVEDDFGFVGTVIDAKIPEVALYRRE